MANTAAKFLFVIGQSNGMNFGTLGLPFPGGWVVDAGIHIWYVPAGTFQTYNPGVNSNGIDGSAVWGPEAEFCRQARFAQPNVDIYIVKNCVNACGVAQKAVGNDWNPFPSAATKQFDVLYNKFGNAVSGLPAGGVPMATTTLWVGNETDTVFQADALGCYNNMTDLALAIRQGFKVQGMRFITSRCFPNATQGPYISTVQAAQMKFGNQRNNSWISLEGTGLFGNNGSPGSYAESGTSPGHLTPASVVKLGYDYYIADLLLSSA